VQRLSLVDTANTGNRGAAVPEKVAIATPNRRH
jgi:hypothetical protein